MGCQADSSWLIALVNSHDAHHQEAITQFESLGVAPSISALAMAEVLSGFPSRRHQRARKLNTIFSSVVHVDAKIAEKAAEIRVEYGISLGDAVIVASALVHDTELLTFDKRMQNVFERLK